MCHTCLLVLTKYIIHITCTDKKYQKQGMANVISWHLQYYKFQIFHFRVSGDEGVVKVEEKEGDSETIIKSTLYNLEFTFDTDVRVAITIYYFATEEISNGQAT